MMKVAITGHSSGIGAEILLVIQLTEPTWEVKCFSKSNGHNIAINDGDDIIQEILDFDPDVLFNNAYYPKIQNKILETLYKEWSDVEKIIINTGSISGYLKDILLDSDSDYVNDKKGLAEFCIRNSFNFPWANKTRLHNISFGFVDTALLTKTAKPVNVSNLIHAEEAGLLMVDLIEKQDYYVVEQVINCAFDSDVEMLTHFNIASRNMLKHVARSNRRN
tara:strand:+ start:293 stop:952 length:660 start_codon:yes stop_codon:yes gene_type:complete